jgi:hypothetical protein
MNAPASATWLGGSGRARLILRNANTMGVALGSIIPTIITAPHGEAEHELGRAPRSHGHQPHPPGAVLRSVHRIHRIGHDPARDDVAWDQPGAFLSRHRGARRCPLPSSQPRRTDLDPP